MRVLASRGATVLLAAVAALATVQVGEAPALADPAAQAPALHGKASADFDRGLAAYRRGNYRAAARAFAAGYAIQPHPDFLFPWAQALRLAGDCAAAVPLYRKVLATVATPRDRRSVQRLIDECHTDTDESTPPPSEHAPEPEPAPTTATEPTPAPPPPESASTPAPIAPAPGAHAAIGISSRAPRRPWYGDGWSATLTAAGTVAVGVGAGFLIAGKVAADGAAAADTLGTFAADSHNATIRYRVGAVALGVGGALVAAGVVHYVLTGSPGPKDEERPSVSITPVPGGPGLSLTGRF